MLDLWLRGRFKRIEEIVIVKIDIKLLRIQCLHLLLLLAHIEDS